MGITVIELKGTKRISIDIRNRSLNWWEDHIDNQLSEWSNKAPLISYGQAESAHHSVEILLAFAELILLVKAQKDNFK